MSPWILRIPKPCKRRINSHSCSTPNLGSPLPCTYTCPCNTPSRSVPSTYTGVRQVKAGPKRSSAALVVTSFMSEAGLRATSAWCRSLTGADTSTGNTTTLKASRGSLARCKASSTLGGKAWVCACAVLASSMYMTHQRSRLIGR